MSKLPIGQLSFVCAALTLGTGCASEVSTPTDGVGGTGGSPIGFGKPLSDECAALAVPLTSTNAFAAAECENLVSADDLLVLVTGDRNGTLDATGVAAAWDFGYWQPNEQQGISIDVFTRDGILSIGEIPINIPDDCGSLASIDVLDSSELVPDAVSRLPPDSDFILAQLEQQAVCLSDDEVVVTLQHSPDLISFVYYDDAGSYQRFCGPCDIGTAKLNCNTCVE